MRGADYRESSKIVIHRSRSGETRAPIIYVIAGFLEGKNGSMNSEETGLRGNQDGIRATRLPTLKTPIGPSKTVCSGIVTETRAERNVRGIHSRMRRIDDRLYLEIMCYELVRESWIRGKNLSLKSRNFCLGDPSNSARIKLCYKWNYTKLLKEYVDFLVWTNEFKYNNINARPISLSYRYSIRVLTNLHTYSVSRGNLTPVINSPFRFSSRSSSLCRSLTLTSRKVINETEVKANYDRFKSSDAIENSWVVGNENAHAILARSSTEV